MDVKIYTIKDLIRKNMSGAIDVKKSKELIGNLAAVSSLHLEHNILLDLRDTTVSGSTMITVFEIVLEFIEQLGAFENKIANIVPNDEERISMAKFWKHAW